MNITSKDSNLLYLFKVLYEEQSLSAATERMALSQPALSHKLKKLRDEFDDPLFVRAARGLTPTPKAHALAPELLKLVAQLERFYQDSEGHDFLSKADTIHIFTTDYMEQLILPVLLPRIHQQAPKLRLVTHNTQGKLPKQELENGLCDIAIAGFFNNLPDSFYQQTLLREQFKVLARAENPFISKGMDLEAYLAAPHIVTTLTGDLDGVADKALLKLGKTRQIAAGIGSFSAPPQVVKQSDFLLTCLGSIADNAVKNDPGLIQFCPPLTLPKVEVVQAWHQRTHDDRIRRWIRQQIKQVANEVRPEEEARSGL
ncbi:LysR family transcriptional regulator [Corallincola platygyrae]|uniref:LysR family transcriptional regulator n=1 Tax=Corallincola platygyrae TaxID=1193278 RepID=A0ABW4XHN8_9GAMM